MGTRTRTMARVLVPAALTLAIAISCPTPIDEALLLVVDDETAPVITVGSPAQNSLYRYTVDVSGTLSDSSGATGQEPGFVRSLAFSVLGNVALPRIVTFSRDGSFTVDPPDPTFAYTPATGAFSFMVDTEALDGMQFFTFVAEDLNGNHSQQTVTLLQDPIGPKLTVNAPLNGSSWPLLLPVVGNVVNENGAASGDRIAKLTTSIMGVESHQLDMKLLELQGDGRYHGITGTAAENFWFEPSSGDFGDSFDLSSASGNLQLMVEVEDARGMASTAFLSLFDNNTGPEIILDDAFHPCPDIYSSEVTTSITMLGWVDPANLGSGTTRYILEPTVGVPRPVQYLVEGIQLDPATGEFWFTFNPQEAPVLEGRLTVHVYAEDNGSRITHETHTIYDDPVSPSGTFAVASGATYANTTATSLAFTISDSSSGMSQMRFNNDGGSWSAWESYSATAHAWTLAAANGTRTVNAEFSDQAGNSFVTSDTIILDTVPPSVSTFRIDGGAAYTTGLTVNLEISAADSLSGMHQMQFSNNGTNWSALETYATSTTLTLTDSDGTRTVFARFIDNAGNDQTASDTIILDRAGPSVSEFTIGAGDGWTGSRSVTLTITATDAASGIAEMRLRNDGGTWGSWTGYSASTGWQLANADGTRTVYMEIRDSAGNVSSASDSIGLDRVSPIISTFEIDGGATSTEDTGVTLTITASDALSGTYQMRFQNDGESWSSWQAYSGSQSWTLKDTAGTRSVSVEVSDQAGNTDSTSDSITYSPP